MAQQNLEQYLRAGVRAAQQGNKQRARELLETVLKRDQNNELAWIWLASVVDSTKERQICLQKVLQINPGNAPARQALNNLVGILGDSKEIDYQALSRAARNQLPPQAADAGGLRSPIGDRADAGGFSRGALLGLLAVFAVVLIGLLLFLQRDTLMGMINPSPTPTATLVQPTITPTFTPTSTPLGGGIRGETQNRPTLTPLPTSTTRPTLTPSRTPTALPTRPPIASYDLLFEAQVGSVSRLYRYDIETEQLTMLADDVEEPDTNLALNRLAFLRTAEGDMESMVKQVFLGDPIEPENATAITRFPENEFAQAVSFSPDGLRVIYSVNRGAGDDDLFIYDTTTGLSRNVTDTPESDIDPHWATENTVVFASDRETPGFYDIYTLNLDDNTVQRVLDRSGNNIMPRMAPDGERIVYVSEEGSQSRIYLTDIRGQRTSALTRTGGAVEQSPTWTSDGRYIVFVSDQGGEESQIYIVPAEGGTPERLATAGLNVVSVRAVRPQ